MNDAVSLLEGSEKDVNLSDIESMIRQLSDKATELEILEERVKAKKEEIDRIETVLLPEMMGGLSQIRTTFGAKVEIQKIVRANIKKEERPKAFEWMDKSGHGDLIKTSIEVAYGRGDIEKARKAYKQLQELGLPAEFHEDVHWQTLNAWARGHLENGGEFPEFIGIYEGKKAKVTYGK